MKAITFALVIASILSALAVFAQDERSVIEARIREWQRAANQNPSDYETLVSIGAAYGKLHEYETSLTYFNKAIAVNPSYADAYAGLGSSYGFLGRPSEALAALNRAVSLNPRNPITQGKLGTTLGKAGRYQDAIVHLKEAVKLAPNMADAHFALGLAYLSADDRKNAGVEVDVLSRLDSQQAERLQRLIARSAAVLAQKEDRHPPSTAQCVTDVNLWFPAIDVNGDVDKERKNLNSLTIPELKARILEMNDCAKAYPQLNRADHDELSAILAVPQLYVLEIVLRHSDFLERHGQTSQFFKEDAEGKR